MPSYDKPTCPQPTKHYLIKKKSRGVKDDGALVKLGDVDLAGKVPIRDLLGKVGEGTKKITEAVTDMLGDSLGLIDNILKKVFSGESSLDKVKKLVTSLVSCRRALVPHWWRDFSFSLDQRAQRHWRYSLLNNKVWGPDHSESTC